MTMIAFAFLQFRPFCPTSADGLQLGTTGDPDELDAIMARLKANPIVENADWSLRTTE